MTKRTIAVIPARAGSKRVPGKNVRQFRGQPLIRWSINAARHGGTVDAVIVSTDDVRAAGIAAESGVLSYERPAELGSDHAGMLEVLQQVCGRYRRETGSEVEFVVLLQPTSPLREQGLIAQGLAAIRRDAQATSLQTVFPVRLFTGSIIDGYWRSDYAERTRSQDLPARYVPSGALYIYRFEQTIARDDAWGTHVLPLVQNPEDVVNIDYEEDFGRLEEVYSRHPERYGYLLD